VFSPVTGELWASIRPPVGVKDRIYTVNTQTGQATLVGQTGFSTRVTAAIAFDTGGRLFGITGSATQTNEFIEIDTATAAGTLVGSMETTELTALTMRVDSLVLGVQPGGHPEVPLSYVLEQNYPNPFNPSTEIRYGLPHQNHVRLTIYNILGQEVVQLENSVKNAGFHTATWNGLSSTGLPLASGLYLYRLEARGENTGSYTRIRKMLLVK
jgi:hypothetical protein